VPPSKLFSWTYHEKAWDGKRVTYRDDLPEDLRSDVYVDGPRLVVIRQSFLGPARSAARVWTILLSELDLASLAVHPIEQRKNYEQPYVRNETGFDFFLVTLVAIKGKKFLVQGEITVHDDVSEFEELYLRFDTQADAAKFTEAVKGLGAPQQGPSEARPEFPRYWPLTGSARPVAWSQLQGVYLKQNEGGQHLTTDEWGKLAAGYRETGFLVEGPVRPEAELTLFEEGSLFLRYRMPTGGFSIKANLRRPAAITFIVVMKHEVTDTGGYTRYKERVTLTPGNDTEYIRDSKTKFIRFFVTDAEFFDAPAVVR
jgi:hypothetical protein